MTSPRDGLLLVDKPAGPTSHDIVQSVRDALGVAQVGHAGTLDPLATGLLPILVGRATRLVRFLPHSPKLYEGTLQLGVTTLTDDVTGAVLATHTGDLPDAERVGSGARSLLGTQLQHPPAISARRVLGVRMYRSNRQAVTVRADATQVHVSRFDVNPTPDGDRFAFTVEVSAGAYVRSLIRDLGQALGCGAALVSLRRMAIGSLRPSAALQLHPEVPPDPTVLARETVPLEDMPLTPPRLTLRSTPEEHRFEHGARIAVPWAAQTTGPVRVHSAAGRLLGVGETQGGVLFPRVVLG